MAKVLSRICMTAMAVLVMAFMYRGSAAAKEITVRGQDIQAALNEARDAGEQATVTIPAGTYNLSSSLLVYSNTTVVAAEGAEITVHGAQPVLTVSPYIEPTNIKVSGGTWRAEEAKVVIHFNRPGSNITLENMTVCGNNYSTGIRLESIDGGKVSNCTVDKAAIGIFVTWSQRIEISGNKISNSAETGIQAEKVENLAVSGNTVLRSGKYGIFFDWDTASSIRKNLLDGCALDPNRAGHGEGLVVRNSEGTWVQENQVLNVESHTKDWGNGILVAFSKNITVQGNTVDHAGNHGIQATFESENVFINDNTVSNSGNMGISISKNTTANITGGVITDTTGSAIVYDGKTYKGKTGVSGTVDGCTIDGSTAAGIHIEFANVTVKNSTVKNSTDIGVAVLNGSIVTLSNNVIRQDEVDAKASGVVANHDLNMGGTSPRILLEGNRICNFGEMGIVANAGCTVSGTNNQVMVNADKFGRNAISCETGATFDKIKHNTLILKTISGTELVAQNYWTDFECGAVVNGVKYPSKIGNGGFFSVSYPQTDSSRVAVYVKDDAGNAIILQASPDFNLNKLESGDTKLLDDFIKRMYRITLDREADAEGLDFYVTKLQSGEMDGSAVAQGFVGSPEFQGKNLSQDDYLAALYSAFFNRVAGPAEIQYWKDEMASGMSRKYVLRGFVNSNEFDKLCRDAGITRGEMVLAESEMYEINEEKLGEFVERLYVKALGRDSEPEGKQYWIEQIASREVTAEEAAKKFFFSPEFLNKNLNNTEYIERLYETFMGRVAEPDGMKYWLGQMSQGMTREVMLSRFAASDEFKQIQQGFGIR